MSSSNDTGVPKNTQNPDRSAVGFGFADIAHTFGDFEDLIATLQTADIRLSVNGERILLNALKGAVTDELRQRIRTHRDGILEFIRNDSGGGAREQKAVEPSRPTLTEDVNKIFGWHDDAATENFDTKGFDDPDPPPERFHPVVVPDDVTSVDLREVPVCDGCLRLSDTVTAMDEWACSNCEPQRSEATARLLALRAELLHRSGPRWSPPPGPRDYLKALLLDMQKVSADVGKRIIEDPKLQEACEKCRSRNSHIALVHEGASLRRDCSGCGKFIENPVWHDPRLVSEFIDRITGPNQ